MSARTVTITDMWFDGDAPNELHPVGVIIDPRLRTVLVPNRIGQVEAPVRDHDGSLRFVPSLRTQSGDWVARTGFRITMPCYTPNPRQLWGFR